MNFLRTQKCFCALLLYLVEIQEFLGGQKAIGKFFQETHIAQKCFLENALNPCLLFIFVLLQSVACKQFEVEIYTKRFGWKTSLVLLLASCLKHETSDL